MRALQKTISLPALRHNLGCLRQAAPHAQIMAVVKADAYGHNVKAILPALYDVPALAVSCLDEALILRQAGAKQEIILLEGVFSREEYALCAEHQLQCVIHHIPQLDWLNQCHFPHKIKTWLKIDSGMHRLGFRPEEVPNVLETRNAPLADWQGYVSHFACADEEDDAPTQAAWQALRKLIPTATHMQACFANSAAILRYPYTHADWVRAGIALYGISPFAQGCGADLGLQAVMRLNTQIIATHQLHAGESAGYGYAFTAPTDGCLAIIALGYGDGFPRERKQASSQERVTFSVNGRRYPLVGRVCMDMSMLWLGEDQAVIGDEVVIFGDDQPVETLARQIGTIPYTLTTMLTARVPTRLEV